MRKAMLLVFTFLFTNIVYAQSFNSDYNPEMLIKYRQDFMTAVKGHNNDIKAIVYGAVPFDNHLNLHLSSLEKMFAEIGSLFPEGSDFGETNAKDAVWGKPEKFQKSISDAKQALATFKQVAEQGDKAKTKAAFKKFGRSSCGSCHKSFKKKQN
ncbi:MAG: cytochrome c [Gammaproteobacteria bacterium]|jgi:cytochrome c556|nr:cytochrome c [Gammaproteobacteria bacterium]MBT3722805.1 cytochrome c [Gammaproteobacteria bacterium]MBT4075156.1 cytochrome c [Gammaproteobacteria bacterium]MBT4451646.1 cytochrome c [Gammaproteobacteria bacterium]MBT4860478.1 cytochrome c [Gammaproteobacteria bacterium]